MISIVIATKDRALFLQRALESLGQQRNAPEFEVVVADNGSTDGTPQVVADAVEIVPYHLRRIEAGRANRGLARNMGIAAAAGELILFVDDDVWLPPNFIAAHAGKHRGGRSRVVTGPILNVPDYTHRPRPAASNYSSAFFCTCNASVSKVALDAVGGFDEAFNLYGWEDTELGLRLRNAGLEHAFAWDAFLCHIKPPEPLELAIRRTVEKATMAARFVQKSPTLRTKLATGAYPLNLARANLVAPLLPFLAGVASSDVLPSSVIGFARNRLLDGLYLQQLDKEMKFKGPLGESKSSRNEDPGR
ncbi:MAG TPA: glycosyltransferase family A protein [Candidatus Baltobacteraceae bacterium]|jgi:glycosyltransferase involved in cell wall biosynthesis